MTRNNLELLLFLFAVIRLSSASVDSSQWGPNPISKRGISASFARGAAVVEQSGTKGTHAHSQRGGGDESSSDGKATITASVFNLVNNVAGAGILTLSAAMASGSGWIPAMLICAVLGALSGHAFAIIGEACELTGEEDFKVSDVQVQRVSLSTRVSLAGVSEDSI